MNRTSASTLRRNLLSTGAFIGFFLLWELGCVVFKVSDLILPRPSLILLTLIEKLPLLMPHALQTLGTTLAGFVLGVLAGMLIGVAIGCSRLAYDVAYPLLVGFSSIPKVAVVPIFVLWFGAGTVPAILTSMVISIFPVVVNVATGLATTEPELEDILRVLGASKGDILWNVGLPRALPYLFASLKIAITLSFVGTVLSETVASNKGIGNVMMIASGNFDVTLVFAGLFILAILGVALYGVCAMIEGRLTGWTQRKGGDNEKVVV
ncbi:MAG: transporter permease [Herbaspirillum sp.]|jgi:NitT/TauT family transport system permease protein|nr:transporter permease [Herbaspirillum sp.]